jgi:F-type H+-transporting ATPase subunit delta
VERLSVIYSQALFDLALKHNAVDEFLSQSKLIRDALSDEDCMRILNHPQISAADKHELFRKAFAGKIHEDLMGFLFLVADKNREAYLISALEALIQTIEHYNRIVTASVLSAAPYNEKQALELKSMLSEKLDKHVELDLKVDPSVIGGPYIFVDGYYIDWTVKKRLRDLTVHLKESSYS